MKEEKGIQYFPIALFSSVMGVSGAAISIRLLEGMFDWNNIFSNTMIVLATFMFIVNAIILLYRVGRFKHVVKMDFNHPVKMNFFGAISISLLLLAVPYYDINITISLVVWILGALFQVGLTLVILSKLFWEHEFKLAQFNPTWFIPIVGNIVAPLAGVYHVEPIINWIFFSVGIVFSIVYLTIFVNRIIFQPTLPPPLTPTFFILLAPPAIGFVSYVKLTGHVDVFAYIMYGVVFYLGLLFLYQAKRFFTIPFFISWWAFLFPSAAVTNATFYLYNETGITFFRLLFIIQVIGLIILTLILFWQTLELIRKRTLCVKDS